MRPTVSEFKDKQGTSMSASPANSYILSGPPFLSTSSSIVPSWAFDAADTYIG